MQEGTIFGEIISRYRVQPDPQKLQVLTEMPPPQIKILHC